MSCMVMVLRKVMIDGFAITAPSWNSDGFAITAPSFVRKLTQSVNVMFGDEMEQ